MKSKPITISKAKRHRWSPVRDRVCQMLREGATVREIAESMGTTIQNIYAIRLNAPLKDRPQLPQRPYRSHGAIEMYRQGLSVPVIAERLGVKYGTVYSRLKRRGLLRPFVKDTLMGRVLSLKIQGHSLDQIAVKLGLTDKQVQQAWWRWNQKLNKQRGN